MNKTKLIKQNRLRYKPKTHNFIMVLPHMEASP